MCATKTAMGAKWAEYQPEYRCSRIRRSRCPRTQVRVGGRDLETERKTQERERDLEKERKGARERERERERSREGTNRRAHTGGRAASIAEGTVNDDANLRPTQTPFNTRTHTHARVRTLARARRIGAREREISGRKQDARERETRERERERERDLETERKTQERERDLEKERKGARERERERERSREGTNRRAHTGGRAASIAEGTVNDDANLRSMCSHRLMLEAIFCRSLKFSTAEF